ncbi:MAG: rod shape-determining protein MreC [Campylobacterota bacterium]|nr:rod shape-determining protein MreC [Campylobacterota bacterium]
MNKKLSFFLIILLMGISYLFNLERVLLKKIDEINSDIKSFYIDSFVSMSVLFNKYLNQLSYIDKLSLENKNNQHYKILYEKKLNQLKELNKNINLQINNDYQYEKIKVLSYYKFNDFSRVIIDKNNIENNKIVALLTLDGYSAGIVFNKEKKTIAYLNQNSRSNYTVFIGSNNAPGITSGMDDSGKLIIKYIPIWKDIKVGDEIITSSMDNIYPYGIKVGRVTDIIVNENTKNVKAEVYADTFSNRYYYIYDKNSSNTNDK